MCDLARTSLCDHRRMLIQVPCVVSLVWRVEDTQGQLIDELTHPVEFFVGGEDLFPVIEQALAGQEAGFSTRIQLEPEQAFGDFDASLVFFEPRSAFGFPLEAGMQFEGVPPGAATQGLQADRVYTITEVYPDHVVFDGNHPLAGIALRLDLTVESVREATAEEIEAGSVGDAAITVLTGARPASPLH